MFLGELIKSYDSLPGWETIYQQIQAISKETENQDHLNFVKVFKKGYLARLEKEGKTVSLTLPAYPDQIQALITSLVHDAKLSNQVLALGF